MTDHTADLKAIHDAIAAIGGMDLSKLSHDDWLETIRGVHQTVQNFSLFVPNAQHIEEMLATGEKILLAWQAFIRITTAKDLVNGAPQVVHQAAQQAGH